MDTYSIWGGIVGARGYLILAGFFVCRWGPDGSPDGLVDQTGSKFSGNIATQKFTYDPKIHVLKKSRKIIRDPFFPVADYL